MREISAILSEETGIREQYIKNVIELIDGGNTIPFIARYRKEMHGSLDDTTLRNIDDRLRYLRNLQARRDEVTASIEKKGKLTEELAEAIANAATLSEVEDLYLPYKQKRRTRATIAREKGLEPLAASLFAEDGTKADPETEAAKYIDAEKGIETAEDALKGAGDIIAEDISDDAEIRKMLRAMYLRNALLTSKAAKDAPEISVYSSYYDFQSALSKVQGYQVLAINRGEREGILSAAVELNDDLAMTAIRKKTVPGRAAMDFVRAAADDAWKRLIEPSMEREMRNYLTDNAADGAIKTFALNLRPLLMQPPVKGKVTMGLDPGYRNGCKVAVVDGTGKVLDTSVVYPTFSERKKEEAIETLTKLIERHGVQHIAIGNGTAGRETEQMTVEMIKRLNTPVSYAIVNEAGASVYSASPLAAEEFPDYDVNLRSAVSIARRLQDPLAELVKIDPKAIGVGQYQHDMPETRLDETLSGVVEDCVNNVGVDINTASVPLLRRVSGLTQATAKNIVKYRDENGIFTGRAQIKKVPKIGPRAFEQCAGFLRVPESANVLDNTGVHPESYSAVESLLKMCGYTLEDVKNGSISGLDKCVQELGYKETAEKLGIGEPTLRDLVKELLKPGRDPRDELPPPILRTDVMEMKDLKTGMELQGTVRNVVDFGAFVDIGVHQDGLVHISRLANRFVRHPSEVVSVGDIVTVWVVDVDEKRKRIGLTMVKE